MFAAAREWSECGGRQIDLMRWLNRIEDHQSGSTVVNGIELTDNLHDIAAVRRLPTNVCFEIM